LTKIAHDDAKLILLLKSQPTQGGVPDLLQLVALSKERKTAAGKIAIDPVFILDRRFVPTCYFMIKSLHRSTITPVVQSP
jgi:hypothetical protein